MPSKPATYRAVGSEAAGQPRRGHVLTPSTAWRPPALGSRLELTNPSTCVDRQPGIGDRGPRRVDRHRAQRARRAPLDRAVRVTDDGHPIAPHVRGPTRKPERRFRPSVLERHPNLRTEAQFGFDAVEQPTDDAQVGLLSEFDVDEHERRRRIRAGRTAASPSRTARPRCPLTGVNSYAGSVEPHAVHTTSGGSVNVAHRAQRATVRTCSAAAAQYGADDLVGHRYRALRRHGMTPSSARPPMRSQS